MENSSHELVREESTINNWERPKSSKF